MLLARFRRQSLAGRSLSLEVGFVTKKPCLLLVHSLLPVCGWRCDFLASCCLLLVTVPPRHDRLLSILFLSKSPWSWGVITVTDKLQIQLICLCVVIPRQITESGLTLTFPAWVMSPWRELPTCWPSSITIWKHSKDTQSGNKSFYS